MERRQIGVVKDLFRYPVKSMRGERLSEVDIGVYGVIGDRAYSIRAGIVSEEPRYRWRRTLLPSTISLRQVVLVHIDRRWSPHLVQANGFRACRRRRQIDRAGH